MSASTLEPSGSDPKPSDSPPIRRSRPAWGKRLRPIFFHRGADEAARSWRRSLLAIVVIVTVLCLGHRSLFAARVPLYDDWHLWNSLGLALGDAFCGTPGRVSSRFSVPAAIRADDGAVDQPLRSLAIAAAGSMPAYCAAVDAPILNNENSLMLAMTLWLRIAPEASLKDIGVFLLGLRIAALAAFGFVLLDGGASLWLVVGAMTGGFAILANGVSHHYSVYPFFFVLLLLAASLYTFAAARGLHACLGPHAAVCGLAGWLAAFGANLRTSHLPVYIVFFGFYSALAFRAPHRPVGGVVAWRRPLAGALAFAAAYVAFIVTFIRPLTPPATSGPAYAHHVIAHPLVLALALPENALSRREGIRWDDGLGLELARRVSPDVTYLGPGYDEALFRYYGSLWKAHPREMLGVYATKLGLAQSDMFSRLLEKSGAGRKLDRLGILGVLCDGRLFMLLYAIVCVGSGRAALRSGRPFPFLLCLLFGAACLLLLESAIIMPFFHAQLHNYLLFMVGFLGLLGAQAALELGRRVWERRRTRG
jgi:hypothetical protein